MKTYLVVYSQLYLEKISNRIVNLNYNPFTEFGIMKLTEELKVSEAAIINIIKLDE